MVHGAVRGLFRLLETLLLVVVAGAALLAWRLSQGPLPLDFLTPYIEDALADPEGAFSVRLERTELTWGGWGESVDLRAVGVHAVSGDEGVIASVPEIAVFVSGRALLRGDLAVSGVEMIGPRIRLFRDAGGALHWGIGDAAAGDSAAVIERLASQLLDGRQDGGPVASLRRVEVVDADITIEDATRGMTWHAPEADVRMRRDLGGLAVDLNLLLDMARDSPRLRGRLTWDAASATVTGTADFGELRPATFAPALPQLARLAAIDVPMTGSVGGRYSTSGGLEEITLELTGGAGMLRLPAPLARDYPVTDLRLRLTGRDALDSLQLHEFHADLGGPSVTLSANAERDGDKTLVKAEASLVQMPVDALDLYWPPGLIDNVREWIVANLSHGMVREARATVSASVSAAGDIAVDAIRGHILPEGVTVRYLAPMPPVHDAVAVATFDRERFRLDLRGGQIFGLKVTDGSIVFDGLQEEHQTADIALQVDGPLADALRLIDHKPLGYAASLGLSPQSVAGESATALNLRFPLLKNLALKDVEIHARSELRRVVIPKVLFGQTVTDGSLSLVVDAKGMDVTGNVDIAGVPGSLQWRENFEGGAFRSRYALKGQLDDEQRGRFGLDFMPFQPPYLTGVVPVEAVATIAANGRGALDAKLDLTGAELALPFLKWGKPVGEKGTGSVRAVLRDGKLTAVSGFSVAVGQDLAVMGAVAFDAGGRAERVDLAKFRCGRTDLRAVIKLRADGGLALNAQGAAFDAAPLLDGERSDRSAAGADAAPAAEEAVPPMTIAAVVDHLWLSESGHLSSVTASLTRDKSDWRVGRLHGLLDSGKPVEAEITPFGDSRLLTMTSPDGGEVLKAFGVFDNMVGGELTVRASIDDRRAARPVSGKLAVTDYQIVKAPSLARLLSVAALTGIADLLRGEGISFSDLDMPFVFEDGKFEIREMRAHGTALGITANGTVDLDRDALAVGGTIVPIYAFNSMFSNLPVLGQILSPERGGGVFAATYSMTGPIDDPMVVVNPLAALAPGVLRNLFNILPGAGTKEDKIR